MKERINNKEERKRRESGEENSEVGDYSYGKGTDSFESYRPRQFHLYTRI